MKVELLAPAGSYKTVVAAIAAGADAVYMGGLRFGARAYAENGDEDTVIKAIEYAHLHGKSLYLTVNTLLKNKEIEEELYNYLLPYYRTGLDAVIVQDPGVLLFIKRHFPDLPIHVSTQMTITGKYSAELLEKMGCSRIVLARELSLEEISDIRRQTSVELESFVHGALCYCYSGQCLMSSMLGGRSGNRGRCAQPCRLPYTVSERGKVLNNEKNQYALSPKDMCTIEILPQIIEAGVFSLKIEGRMKKPEYTAGVVRIYRKYIDMYLRDPGSYQVDKRDLQELFDLYNRDGFHKGYYLNHNGPDMMAVRNLKFTDGQNKRNEVLFQQIKENYVEKADPISIDGCLELYKGKPAKLTIGNVKVEGAIVDSAMKQPLSEERTRRQIQKTGNTPFVFKKLDVKMDNDIFMPMQSLNELRRNGLEILEKELVSGYYRKEPVLIAPEKTDYSSGRASNEDELFAVSVETKEQLNVVLRSPYIKRIYVSITMFQKHDAEIEIMQMIQKVKNNNKECFLALPYILRRGKLDYVSCYFRTFIENGLDGYLVRNLESLSLLHGLQLLSYVIIDANLYTYNSESQNFYRSLGVEVDTAPFELNFQELSHRNNSQSEMVIYGYQPLMISAQCLKKNFSKCSKNYDMITLQDRYHKNFQVRCVCDFCYNIIYNSIPLGILKESQAIKDLNFIRLRLNFTLESAKETTEILNEFYDVYFRQKVSLFSTDRFTKGHLKRGVE